MEPPNLQTRSTIDLRQQRISRRDALKAGGIAAVGLAFSKPLIETLRPRTAFASLSPIPGGPSAMPLSGSVSAVGILPGESVDHMSEFPCNGTKFAGAKVSSSGLAAPLGPFSGEVSAAWDWAAPVPGAFAPTSASFGGVLSGFSATILGSYPQAFCSSAFVATGIAKLKDSDGDEITGMVTGGEIYEAFFGFFPGDGQESFLTVTITGGTGKWAGATGGYTTHSIIKIGPGPSLVVVFSDISGVVFV
jgi:hypothetical protein